jgi:uncharacterized membrane protein
LIPVIFIVLVLSFLSLLPLVGAVQSLRLIGVGAFILFLPGFLLSKLFFAESQLSALQRSAVSIALSIAIVPLILLYLVSFGMHISAITVLGVTLVVCIICGALLLSGVSFVDSRRRAE